MRCADANPWDGSILCELAAGHVRHTPVKVRGDLHESEGVRWSDACHFPDDDCDPCAALMVEATHNTPGEVR